MDRVAREQARGELVRRMQAGERWDEAAAAAGYATSRSAAYRWRQRVAGEGQAGLVDRRQGHPSKLRHPIQEWLVAYCQEHPATPAHVLQAEIVRQFDVQVSLTQIRTIRRRLGVSLRQPHPKKAG